MSGLSERIHERAAELIVCHRAMEDGELTVEHALALGSACGRVAALKVLAEYGMLVTVDEG